MWSVDPIEKEKKLWVFHHYATLPNQNGHIRPYYFGNRLKKYGYFMTVFSASYLHFSDRNLINDDRKYAINTDFEIPYVFINTPSSKAGGFSRIRNMLGYSSRLFSISKEIAEAHGKPDVILASSPHPFAMIAGILIARRLGVPCICEIRDLWPEAIFMVSKLSEKGIIGKLLTAGEHWIYKNADALIFTKEGDVDYLIEKGWDIAQGGDIDLRKCHYINNGVDLESFNSMANENVIDDPDLQDEKFKVVYTGAIRPLNNVGAILNAAKLLKNKSEIQFLIYGEGNQLEELKTRVTEENITNVKLKGFVEKKYIPYILSRSSINLLNYSQIQYNWSRGNSSNKLFEYMASGKPIISTVKMGYNPLDHYACGISLENNTAIELASAIKEIHSMPKKEIEKMGNNARIGAKHFDYTLLTEKLVDVIEGVSKE